MQAKLIVNDTDFSLYIKEGGLILSDTVRCGRSVVTMDGVEHRSQIIKRNISVQLVELRDGTLSKLTEALTSPAVATYTDRNGREWTGTFHVSGISAAAKTVRGGNTYWNGVSFSLETR